MINIRLKKYVTAKKWSFALRIFSVNVSKSAVSCYVVTFIEKSLNGKLHFLWSDKVVDDFLPALKFVSDWFVTSKMIKKLSAALYADDGLLFF